MAELATPRRALRPFFRIGSRAAVATVRPLAGAASVVVQRGLGFERRAVGRVLDSPELERLVVATLDSQRVQTGFAKALESQAAKHLVATFFESSLFEEVVVRLLESRPLWQLVEELADSPTVTAVITGQSLSFADQVGDEVRHRSRRSDEWVERAARRLSRGHATGPPPTGGVERSGGGS